MILPRQRSIFIISVRIEHYFRCKSPKPLHISTFHAGSLKNEVILFRNKAVVFTGVTIQLDVNVLLCMKSVKVEVFSRVCILVRLCVRLSVGVCRVVDRVCQPGLQLTLSDRLTGSRGPGSQRRWWEHSLIGVIGALLGTCLLRETPHNHSLTHTHPRLSTGRQTSKVTALHLTTQCLPRFPRPRISRRGGSIWSWMCVCP